MNPERNFSQASNLSENQGAIGEATKVAHDETIRKTGATALEAAIAGVASENNIGQGLPQDNLGELHIDQGQKTEGDRGSSNAETGARFFRPADPNIFTPGSSETNDSTGFEDFLADVEASDKAGAEQQPDSTEADSSDDILEKAEPFDLEEQLENDRGEQEENTSSETLNFESGVASDAESGKTAESGRNLIKPSTNEKLKAVQEEFEALARELHSAKNNKEKLDEDIANYESTLAESNKEIDRLTDRAKELEGEVSRSKRRIIAGFVEGLRLAKNILFGGRDNIHDRIREVTEGINESVEKNEKAKTEYDDVAEDLESARATHLEVSSQHQDIIDERKRCQSRISRLEKRMASAKQQIERLKEESANESWAEAWKDAQEGIKREMGTENMWAFRNSLRKEERELAEQLEGDIQELDRYRQPSRVDRLMKTDEQLEAEAAKADEVEEKLRDEYDRGVASIEAKRAKVDQYFPTWLDRIKNLRENQSVSSALASIKRKALIKIYDIM